MNLVLALNLSPVYLKSKKRNEAVELPDMNKNVFYFNKKLLVYFLIHGGISPSPATLMWNGFATEK